MTTGPHSDPKQWHRSRAWTDALVKTLPPHRSMVLAPQLHRLAAPALGCVAVNGGVHLQLGSTALELRPAEAGAVSSGTVFTPEQLIAADGSSDGRKGVKLLEEWLQHFIDQAPPPQPSSSAQADFWRPYGAPSEAVIAAGDGGVGGGGRKYRLRLDLTLPTAHLGYFQPLGGSFAEALGAAAQLQWYVTGTFLNVADRGAYAGRLQWLGSGATPLDTTGAAAVSPRFGAWVELGGGRDRLIQAAMELRRLAETLVGDATIRGEMGLVTDTAPALTAAVEDVFIWSGSLNWGERLVLGWEQAGWLREMVDCLVELHRKRCLNEALLRTLGQAALWTHRDQAGSIRVVRLLTDYFDRHGRNRHFPPDLARRLALSLGRNEKFMRHRPYPARPGLAPVEQLMALAIRLVRLQCGMKRPARYCRPGTIQNNGAHPAAASAVGRPVR